MRRLAGCRPKEARSMTRQLIAALIALSLLTACGKKGPLYLPDQKKDEKPEETQTPPPSVPGY
jgi:predicted small lipoprotein YifL